MNVSESPAASATDAELPLIGITSYLEQAQTGVWDVRASFLPKVYLDAVTDVGGIAIVLPRSRWIPRSPAASSPRWTG
ncbi:gamma-glutamyl-gamma-aminobutyrate hydrolase family protein [Leucobacter sp. HNU]|uniref:gamma-glutamyl-gamma-aminobutyrate hydrolase family protein n=1 Tax=Leucobacter sp. HNU TaxID=3236805 RepID=UPI003A7FBDC5